MIKHYLSSMAVAVSLAATPLAAQDEAQSEPSMEDMGAAMSGMFGDGFTAEPLTAAQEARLPAALRVVEQIFPPGTYAKMMDESMKPMFEGMMGGALGDGGGGVEKLGVLSGEGPFAAMKMDKESRNRALALLDPAHKERGAATTEAMLNFTASLMNRIEPAYREGLSRAYAKRFETAELQELQRFFSTPVGSHYAAESMLIYADPQVMAAMQDMMPAAFEMLPQMMEEMEAVSDSLPPERSVSELSSAEQAELAELLGVSVDVLTENAEMLDEDNDEVAVDAVEE